jgi:hypothetical protein
MKRQKGPKSDLTGQVFGHLKVTGMEVAPLDRRREYRAICKCLNCGKKNHPVFPYHLKNGLSKSCGCLGGYRKRGEECVHYRGYKGLAKSVWTKIKRGAIRRKLDFSITMKEVWELFEKQQRKCALTGLPLVFGEGRKMGSASLDRKDSGLGYTLDNVQWVHRNVNVMKYSCSQRYFLTMCRKVANNDRLKNIQDLTDEEILSQELFMNQQHPPMPTVIGKPTRKY